MKRSFVEKASGVLFLAMAVTLAVIRATHSDPAERAAGPLDPIAFGALFGVPGFLALLARRERTVLYLGAAVSGTVLSFIAFSGATLPLLIPSGMAIAAFARRSGDTRTFREVTVPLACFLGAAGALAVMFLHADMRCVTTPTYSSCSSDVLVWWEALASIAIGGLTVVLAYRLARPRSDDR
jgi:hypothetical protein